MAGRRLTRLTLSIICWVIMSYAGDVDASVLTDSDTVHSLSQKKVAPSSKKVNGRPAATSYPTGSRHMTARDGKVAKIRVSARQTLDPEQVVWVDGTVEGARRSDQPNTDAPQAKNVQPAAGVSEGDSDITDDGLEDQGGSLSSGVKAAVKDPTALEHDDGDDQVLWAEDGDRGGEAAEDNQQSLRGQAGGAQGTESQGQQVANPGPSTSHGTDTEGQGGAPLTALNSSPVTLKPVPESSEPSGSIAGEGSGHAVEGDDAVVWTDGNSAGRIEGGSKREGDAEKAADASTSEGTEHDQKHLESKSSWDRGSLKSKSGEFAENKSPADGSSHGSTNRNETGPTVGGSSSSTSSTITKGTSAWGSRGDGTPTALGGGGQRPVDSSSSSSHYNSSSSHYNNGNIKETSGNDDHSRSSNGASDSTSSSSSSGGKSAWDRSSISGGAQKGVEKSTPTKTSTTTAKVGANSTTNSESGSSSSGGSRGSTDSRSDSGMSSHFSSSMVDNGVGGDSARGPSSSSSNDNKDSGGDGMESFPWGDDVSGTSGDSIMQPASASSSTHTSPAATGSTNSNTVEPPLTNHAGSLPATGQLPKADVAGSDAASLSQTNTNAGVVTTTTTTTVTTTTGPAGAVTANSGSSRQNDGGGGGTWVILNGQKVWVAENSAVAIDGPWSMSDPSGRVSSDDMAHLKLRSTQRRPSTPTKIDPEQAYNGLANLAVAAGLMTQMAAKENGGQAAGAMVPAVTQAATGVVDTTNKAVSSSNEGVSSATNSAVSSLASNTQNVTNGATKSANGAVSDVNTAVYGVTPTSSTDVTPKPSSITTLSELSSPENEMAECLRSLGSQTQTDQIFETWDKGVSQTAAGQVASQTLQHAIGSLNLNPADASKLKASYALYDTWLKTGSPARRRRRQRRSLQLGAGDSSLVNTYSALTSSLTTPCKAAYKSISTDEGSGRSGGSSSGSSSSGEMHCNTYAKPAMSLQLCQGTTISSSSSTIQVKGSVTNTGTAAVCPLTLSVENFDKAISFYPTWLPTYRGTFMPGDVATFSVTLPAGLMSTQVSIGEDVAACEAPAQQATSASTTAATGGSRGDYGGVQGQGGIGVGANGGTLSQASSSQSQGPIQSSSALSQQAPTMSASSVFMTDGGGPKFKSNLAAGRGPMTSLSGIDWGVVGGADTSCLAMCMFIINDMTHCEAYDAIGAFRCDTCSAETYATIQQTCRGQGCTASKCHVSEAKGPTNGGQSVKNNISLILGVLTVFLMMQLT